MNANAPLFVLVIISYITVLKNWNTLMVSKMTSIYFNIGLVKESCDYGPKKKRTTLMVLAYGPKKEDHADGLGLWS